jgi:hypothetical protein
MKTQRLTVPSIIRPSSDRASRWLAFLRGTAAPIPPAKVVQSNADPQVEVKRSEPRRTLSLLDTLMLDLL